MSVLLVASERFLDHLTGAGHPEAPERLTAVLAGIEAAGVEDALVRVPPRPATRSELEGAHAPRHVDGLESFCATGGGAIDPDTVAGQASWTAAVLAAGAGPTAVERLRAGEADAAFLAVRPPGHHATPRRAMGFCLLNNVAVTAAALADSGERVLVVDWDAHHGNGTQDRFYGDDRVAYVSIHQDRLYPFTGHIGETGVGAGLASTVNLPVPAGATGDVYAAALDELVSPFVARFQPTWVLVSAGFDAHRADPLTDLGLSAGDFADLTRRVCEYAPPGRRVFFLEGGYDLTALADSAGACVAALAGREHRPEAATTGGPGRRVIDDALRSRG